MMYALLIKKAGLQKAAFSPFSVAAPAMQSYLRGAYTYFEKASQVVGGGLPNEMNLLCSPLWKVFSVKAAVALGASIQRPIEAPHPSVVRPTSPFCSPSLALARPSSSALVLTVSLCGRHRMSRDPVDRGSDAKVAV